MRRTPAGGWLGVVGAARASSHAAQCRGCCGWQSASAEAVLDRTKRRRPDRDKPAGRGRQRHSENHTRHRNHTGAARYWSTMRAPTSRPAGADPGVYVVPARPQRTLADADALGAADAPPARLHPRAAHPPAARQRPARGRPPGAWVGSRCGSGAAVAALAVLLGALFFLRASPLAIGVLGRGWVLTAVQWLLAGFAVLWAVLFVDAWRLGRPATLLLTTRRWLTGVTAALLVVTSGGLVYAANTVGAGRDAMSALFQGDEACGAVNGRYNILLLGGRLRARPRGHPPGQHPAGQHRRRAPARAVTFGFSRDTENINFRPGSTMARLMPEGWNCGDECLLNGLYTWAQDNAAKFPAGTHQPRGARHPRGGRGAQRPRHPVLRDGRPPGLQEDGRRGRRPRRQRASTAPRSVAEPHRSSGGSSPGPQHLDGYHALWYARSRQGSTNYERMARQRCVMTAMADQLDPQTVLVRFQKIAGASSGLIQTDLPQSELGRFADLAMKTRAAQDQRRELRAAADEAVGLRRRPRHLDGRSAPSRRPRRPRKATAQDPGPRARHQATARPRPRRSEAQGAARHRGAGPGQGSRQRGGGRPLLRMLGSLMTTSTPPTTPPPRRTPGRRRHHADPQRGAAPARGGRRGRSPRTTRATSTSCSRSGPAATAPTRIAERDLRRPTRGSAPSPNPSGRTPDGAQRRHRRAWADTDVVVRVDGHGAARPRLRAHRRASCSRRPARPTSAG